MAAMLGRNSMDAPLRTSEVEQGPMSRFSDRRALATAVGLIAIVAIAATTWIYAAHLTYYDGAPIRSDGFGYYAYLPAVLLDHDLTMVRTAARSFDGPPTNIPGVNSITTSSGKQSWLDQYGIGVAVLLAPFFALGHLGALATGAARTGFTWPYQVAASAGGLCYMLLGLVLTGRVLLEWFSRRTALVTVVALTFGAAVFQYGTYDTTFSHAYSFFLIALTAWLAPRVWERASPGRVAALGAVLGLVGLVRPTNLTVLAFCALVGVERLSDLRVRAAVLLRRFDLVALGAAVALIVLIPQFAYWAKITGSPLVNPYRGTGQHLDLLRPHLIGVLFSVRKGLYFWTPLLLLATIGLPVLRRIARPLWVAATIYLALSIWVVSSWSVWWYGGSFGMRALIDVMPVFALGLAALIEAARNAVVPRRMVLIATAVTTLLAVHAMIAYWLKTVPYDHTNIHEYLQSFLHA